MTGPCLVLRELQEREKALWLQKERLQRELEGKKKVQGSRGWVVGGGARSGSVLSFGLGSPDQVAPGVGAALLGHAGCAWGLGRAHSHGP